MSLVLLAAALAAGCNGAKKPDVVFEHRVLPQNIGQMILTAKSLEEIYAVGAFVYAERDPQTQEVVVTDSTTASPDTSLRDKCVLILVEGSGDKIEGFLYTARLLAASQYVWTGHDTSLLILPVHWSQLPDPVLEHVDLDGQKRGAVQAQDMVRVHALRYGAAADSWVSLLGFSAGTRVIQMAFGAKITPGQSEAALGDCPPHMSTVRNIVFIGSSLSRRDPLPFQDIRGRFLNFINRRDTHFGDQAPFIAPAGSGLKVERVFNTTTIFARPPGIGASAFGFDALPLLTSGDQFDVADSTPKARQAFGRVNVRVPEALAAYNLVGGMINNDDLDMFINLAPNHYILTGRGPAGMTGGPQFDQYRDMAVEFVRDFLVPAAVSGRIVTTELAAKPKPITAFDILTSPITVPGKMMEPLLKKLEEQYKIYAPRPTPPPDAPPQIPAPTAP